MHTAYTPVYYFFGSLMKYFGPLQILDFGENRLIDKPAKVANIDGPVHEFIKKVERPEVSNPQALIGWTSCTFYLLLYFCCHSAFMVARIFQYMINPETVAAITAANLLGIVVVGFAAVPYHAFVVDKRKTEQLLRSWRICEKEILSGLSSFPLCTPAVKLVLLITPWKYPYL